jgi:tripartite-type tricarboxylate transporter receptor subunit TctC
MGVRTIWFLAAILGGPGMVDAAQAQTYPDRAITLVIPFAPGAAPRSWGE